MVKQAHRMTVLRGEHQVECQTSECKTRWHTHGLHADYAILNKHSLAYIVYTIPLKEMFQCFLSQRYISQDPFGSVLNVDIIKT